MFSSCETSHALGAFERLSRKTRHRRRVDVDVQSQSETFAFINLQRQHALNFVRGTSAGTIIFCLENRTPNERAFSGIKKRNDLFPCFLPMRENRPISTSCLFGGRKGRRSFVTTDSLDFRSNFVCPNQSRSDVSKQLETT